jgi:hypothetical protein
MAVSTTLLIRKISHLLQATTLSAQLHSIHDSLAAKLFLPSSPASSSSPGRELFVL